MEKFPILGLFISCLMLSLKLGMAQLDLSLMSQQTPSTNLGDWIPNPNSYEWTPIIDSNQVPNAAQNIEQIPLSNGKYQITPFQGNNIENDKISRDIELTRNPQNFDLFDDFRVDTGLFHDIPLPDDVKSFVPFDQVEDFHPIQNRLEQTMPNIQPNLASQSFNNDPQSNLIPLIDPSKPPNQQQIQNIQLQDPTQLPFPLVPMQPQQPQPQQPQPQQPQPQQPQPQQPQPQQPQPQQPQPQQPQPQPPQPQQPQQPQKQPQQPQPLQQQSQSPKQPEPLQQQPQAQGRLQQPQPQQISLNEQQPLGQMFPQMQSTTMPPTTTLSKLTFQPIVSGGGQTQTNNLLENGQGPQKNTPTPIDLHPQTLAQFLNKPNNEQSTSNIIPGQRAVNLNSEINSVPVQTQNSPLPGIETFKEKDLVVKIINIDSTTTTNPSTSTSLPESSSSLPSSSSSINPSSTVASDIFEANEDNLPVTKLHLSEGEIDKAPELDGILFPTSEAPTNEATATPTKLIRPIITQNQPSFASPKNPGFIAPNQGFISQNQQGFMAPNQANFQRPFHDTAPYFGFHQTSQFLNPFSNNIPINGMFNNNNNNFGRMPMFNQRRVGNQKR